MNRYLILLTCIFLHGCSQIGHYLYEGPPMEDTEHAVIAIAGPRAVIQSIDGKKRFYGSQSGIVNRVYMPPGAHTIELIVTTNYQLNTHDAYYKSITMEFEAGHSYEPDSDRVDSETRRFYITDWGTDFDHECFDIRYRNGVFNPEGKCPWKKGNWIKGDGKD